MIVCRHVVLALVFFLCMTGGAAAQSASAPAPAEALPMGEGTYLDLVERVIAGITLEKGRFSGGALPAGIRHIDGGDAQAIRLAPTGFLRLASVPLLSGGKDRLALLIDLGATEDDLGFSVLALFDVAGAPRLLDAANVAFDRSTSFLEPARLPLGTGSDLLVTQSTHHNSSQGYAITALILLRDDRLALVDAIDTLSERECGFERRQEVSLRTGDGEPLADIVAVVSERTTLTAEDCGGAVAIAPGERVFTVTYRWDAAAQRYQPDSEAFTRLARENEARF